jgi:LemA protein
VTGGNKDEILKTENELSGTLKSLFALSESYPDLKATGNFVNLQNELSDTENKIQAARRFYNNVVMDFNTATQTFPYKLLNVGLNPNLVSFEKEDAIHFKMRWL